MSTFARSTNHGRAFVTAFVSVAFLWALALSASPQLHQRVHPDAGRVEHGRLRPVARGLAQAALPLTGRQVVAELDRERVRRSCPVVAAPRVIRERRRRRDGRYCSDRGDSA